MFTTNALAKLYPHLQFRQRSPSPTPNRAASPARYSPVKEAIKPKPPVEDDPPVVPISAPVPVPAPAPAPPKEEVVNSLPPPPKVVVPKGPPPKRNYTKKPKLEVEPVREDHTPQKGEKGYRPKYDKEQRKKMYLDNLSRKSVHLAEQEVSALNEILESNNHNEDKLEQLAKETSNKLRLINRAKFFTIKESSNINNVQTTSVTEEKQGGDLGGDLPSESEGPEVS